MKRIRVFVIEDNRLMREGLTAMLKVQPEIQVVGSQSNSDLPALGKRANTDVVLLDLGFRSKNNLRVIESIRAKNPLAKIVVMDLGPVQPALVEYVKAGVSGFILQDATLTDFIRTIREVANGSKVMPSTLTSPLLVQIAEYALQKGDAYTSVRMTKREREVVDLIAEGLSNKNIASRLNLSVDTVKSHVHNILDKLALHTRLEIASYMHADAPFQNFLPPDE